MRVRVSERERELTRCESLGDLVQDGMRTDQDPGLDSDSFRVLSHIKKFGSESKPLSSQSDQC